MELERVRNIIDYFGCRKWRILIGLQSIRRFPRQPEVLEYLNYVADKFDMKKDIQFNTRVKLCYYNKVKNIWTITTEGGESFTCKYFVSASGVLSVGRQLPFKGTEKFKGESYKTFAWPKEEISYKDKRVAVIGTGATAVQIIPIVAHNAKELTVFQRTPNFVLPARNHPLTEDQQNSIKDRYDQVWDEARNQTFGMHITDSKLTLKDMKSKEQHRRILEYGWEVGGFRFIFETFGDLIVSQEANDIASDFVREKIRTTVKDEETAERLIPDYPLFAKRPPLGHYYFETFNKPHVKLVDIKNNAIREITETGVRLEGGEEYEFDIIIYAIGFDASTGAMSTIDVRGTEEISLGEHWNQHLETFLVSTLLVTTQPSI
jgi:cyclohexanone monooxygenase